MKYHRCSKDKLATFAKDRGIHVQSTLKHRRAPGKRDLLRALKQADMDRTLRFLDLPPELRNMVYRELLVIKQSRKKRSPESSPQILATSKAVNQEATGILYAENPITVRVCPSGLYARGVKCGTYEPQTKMSAHLRTSPRATDMVWPEFLGRVHAVQLVIVDMQDTMARRPVLPNCGTVHNILFSLCHFLRQTGKIRTFTMDLTWLTSRFIRLRETNILQNHLHTTLYPLRLLSDKVKVNIYGTGTMLLEQPLTPHAKASELAERIVSGHLRTTLHQLQGLWRLAISIERPFSRSRQPDGEVLKLLMDGVSAAVAGGGFLLAAGSAGLLRRMLSCDLGSLRDKVDSAGMNRVPLALEKQLETVLMLGVELERAGQNSLEG